MYEVNVEIFEGPLDLLLHLVDKNRLDITEIALASIVDEYRGYLGRLRELDLEIESSFLTIFASLLEIKSKVLLPSLPVDDEEEEEDEHELVRRLREYKLIKDAAAKLAVSKEKMDDSFPRSRDDDALGDETYISNALTAVDLMDAYLSVLRRLEKKKAAPAIEMAREDISLPFIMRLINKKIRMRRAVKLHEFFQEAPGRMRFIVIFLALLEMARRRRIRLIQDLPGKDITVVNVKYKSKEADAGVRKLAG